MKKNTKYCKCDCKYLAITEKEQNEVREIIKITYPHICRKYKTEVYHYEHHPKLVMLDRCNEYEKSLIKKIYTSLKNMFFKKKIDKDFTNEQY